MSEFAAANEDPTTGQLAASIGCDPGQIIRSVLHTFKTATRSDGRSIWTSFVDDGGPEIKVFDTVWPQ